MTTVSLEWSYWQTGIELWYQGCSLLRVAEIMPKGFPNCEPCPREFSSAGSSTPIEPSLDSDDLSFQLGQQWMPVEMTPNSGVEILVPDHVYPSVLRQQYSATGDEGQVPELSRYESYWMSAQLLAMVVHLVDSLLEEWYSGIGNREGLRLNPDQVVPYINRIIPCPMCVSGAEPLMAEVFHKWSDIPPSDLLDTDEEHFSQPTSSAEQHRGVKRDLLPILNSTKQSDTTEQPCSAITVMEEEEEVLTGNLMRASKFGFMIENCFAASCGLDPLVCPAHPDLELCVGDLAPDLVKNSLVCAYSSTSSSSSSSSGVC